MPDFIFLSEPYEAFFVIKPYRLIDCILSSKATLEPGDDQHAANRRVQVKGSDSESARTGGASNACRNLSDLVPNGKSNYSTQKHSRTPLTAVEFPGILILIFDVYLSSNGALTLLRRACYRRC